MQSLPKKFRLPGFAAHDLQRMGQILCDAIEFQCLIRSSQHGTLPTMYVGPLRHPCRIWEFTGLSCAGFSTTQHHDVVAVYDRHTYDAEKRDALQVWAQRLSGNRGEGGSGQRLNGRPHSFLAAHFFLDITAENGDDLRMRYAGGKGKCYQHIINLLPPHTTYIETHLGGGAVLRHKKRAETNIGIDRDPNVIRAWQRQFPFLASFIEADAVDYLTSRRFVGDELLYCDPPYLPITRRRERVYRYDYNERDHIRLLEVLKQLPCRVVVSGYPSALYDESLQGWNIRSFRAKAHDGLRAEQIWFNFEPPVRVHDDRYLGRDFRERETIKRRVQRVQKRIASLSPQEQYSISDWLDKRLSLGTGITEKFCNLKNRKEEHRSPRIQQEPRVNSIG